MKILIVTTRHWSGDPRLNRHASYLGADGHDVAIRSFSDQGRLRSMWSAARAVSSAGDDAVILPDPELFALGALVARARRIHPVIDIHEDYPKTASNRTWIPRALKPIVSIVARSMVGLGRLLAWRTIVAAPQLSRRRDTVVLNTPDPSAFTNTDDKDLHQLVYVGDITVPRGAIDMLHALAALPDDHELTLIGPIEEETRRLIEATASHLGVDARVNLLGRLDHEEAWRMASRAQFGLSLLHDTPAYREAVATKLWEYMASGVIPVVSRLPGQTALVSAIDSELACSGPYEVAGLIRRLAADTQLVDELSSRARAVAEKEWDEARPDLEIQAVFTP